MKLDKKGVQLIASFEGLRLNPYLDSVNIPTIGFGNTFYPNGKRVTMFDTSISKERAFELLDYTAQKFATDLDKLISKPLTQNQFNAVVSLAYNIGLGNIRKSTLLKFINANPNDAAIRSQFMKWNKAGGKVIDGLNNRRKKEADLYFS